MKRLSILTNVQLIELHDIDKQNRHPSISGMKSICDQLLEAIRQNIKGLIFAFTLSLSCLSTCIIDIYK